MHTLETVLTEAGSGEVVGTSTFTGQSGGTGLSGGTGEAFGEVAAAIAEWLNGRRK